MDSRASRRQLRCRLRARRWRVGWRHVEIGLEQVYTNVALSRLRSVLMAASTRAGSDLQSLTETVRALNKLLDLDLAIIEDAYQAEYMARLQAHRATGDAGTGCRRGGPRASQSAERGQDLGRTICSMPETRPPRRRRTTSSGSSEMSSSPTT